MRSFFKAASWVLASNVLVKVINFALLNIIARYLSPLYFGMYTAIISSATSVNQISDLGSSMVLQRSTAKYAEVSKVETGRRFTIVFLLQFCMNILFAVAIVVFPAFFAGLLFQLQEGVPQVGWIGLIAVLQMLFQVPITFILGLSEYRIYALRWLLGSGLSLAITLLAIWLLGPTVENLLCAFVISACFNVLLTLVLTKSLMNQHQIQLSIGKFRSSVRKIFKEGFIYYGGNILAGAIFNFALIGLFSKYIGLDQYGYVRIANAIVAIMSVVPAAFQSVTLTYLAKEENEGAAIKSAQLRLVSIMSFMFSVILICYIKIIIHVLFGREYSAGWEIFVFILLLNIVTIINSLLTSFLVSKGFGSYVGWVSTIGVALNAVLSFILIPHWGIYGFFVGQAVGFGFGFLMVLRKEFTLFLYPDQVVLNKMAIVMLAGVFFLVPVFLQMEGIWMEIYKVIYILIVGLILFQVAISREEKMWLVHFVKAKYTRN